MGKAKRTGRWTALRRLGAMGLAVATAVSLIPSTAVAVPPTPFFPGPGIDAYAAYQGQSTCDPTAKPGVLQFRDLLQQAYGIHGAGIVRECSAPGVNEHKEGRALDYHFNYDNAEDRSEASDLLHWLLATDQFGNAHAMVRRIGIMYIIWNRQIWEAYRPNAGWQPYNGESPHTDHIHFSFSWAGARMQTSWWTAGAAAGRVFHNMRYEAGQWSGAGLSDNGRVHAVAMAPMVDNDMHQITVDSGKIYHNVRRANGTWTGAGLVDGRGGVSAVAGAGTGIGEMHLVSVAAGNVYHNLRRFNGTWTGPGLVDTGVTGVAAVGMLNNDMHLLTLTRGRVYHRIRYADGNWSPAGLVDNDGSIGAIAAAGTGNGQLHVLTLARGRVYHNLRYTDGNWSGAGLADGGGAVSAIAAGGTGNGNLHLIVVVGGRAFHNMRRPDATWTGPGLVDNSGQIRTVAATGTPDNRMQLATVVP